MNIFKKFLGGRKSKKIVLMRHGAYAGGWVTARPEKLTAQGIQDVKVVARQLIKRNIYPDIILHSPLPRTKETAQIVAEEFKTAGIEVALRANDNLEEYKKKIPEVLLELEKEQTVFVISHGPDLDQAAYRLTDKSYTLNCADALLIESPQREWRNLLVDRLANKMIKQFVPRGSTPTG